MIKQLRLTQNQHMQKKLLKKRQPLTQIEFIQYQIFEHLNCGYQIHDIKLTQQKFDSLHTIFIPSEKDNTNNIYLGHGFGGSSLMYFPIIPFLLQRGNIILWQIRGMGVSEKPNQFDIQQSKITQFFVSPLQKLFNYYDDRGNNESIILIGHSFSCYISLRYLIRNRQQERIKKLILLSPVGITPKQNDYKNQVSNCEDFFTLIGNKFCWFFNLTYKSIFRSICCCMKNSILRKSFSQYNMNQKQLQLMVKIFETMINLPDGSQNSTSEITIIGYTLESKVRSKNIYIFWRKRLDRQNWLSKFGKKV